MKLEHQVVSLELAKKLKELGVKQESLYWWVNRFPWSIQRHEEGRWSRARTHSAFTVAELGEILTPYLEDREGDGKPIPEGAPIVERMGLLWEPDFLAKMLIYLLENNLMTSDRH